MQHHDIEPLPNGNVLLIAWEYRSREDAVAAGRDPEHLGDKGFWPDFVVEIEPVLPDGGKVVWEWHAWDHLIQDFDDSKANFGDVTARPERIDVNGDHRDVPPMSAEERERLEELEQEMRALGYTGDDDEEEEEAEGEEPGGGRGRRVPGDWLHTNGIDYHSGLDLIVLSARRFHEVWIIDHSTTTAEAAGSRGGRQGRGGDLLYRWGNPRTYGRGTDADRRLFGQHDATFVEGPTPGVPHVLVFNNGEGRPGGNFSSVDEIALPFDPERGFPFRPDGAFEPQEPAWSYVAPKKESFFSSFISGAQRLPDGNTLICSGAPGRLFEVTREKEIVWDYLNPFGKHEDREAEPPPAGQDQGPRGDRPPTGPKPEGGRGGGGPKTPKGLFSAGRGWRRITPGWLGFAAAATRALPRAPAADARPRRACCSAAS